MKNLITALLLAITASGFSQTNAKTENVILVTFDGYRWKELFDGAQKNILSRKKFTHNRKKLESQFWDDNLNMRRVKLMPFFWGTIVNKGQIYGNRKLGSKVTVTNLIRLSYPGYNEIFTGHRDPRINRNHYGDNPNTSLFDFLQSQKAMANKVAAFATWDAFTRIINVKRNNVPVFADLKPAANGTVASAGITIDKWQTQVPPHSEFSKQDTATYHFAKEYLQRYHPHFAFIGFDETDDFAHERNYDAYLNTAYTLDGYMRDLWEFVQNDPQYKGKTTLIITCDHGRGIHPIANWQRHHGLVPNCGGIWIAAVGAGISPKGEVKTKMSLHQNQLAATIAKLLGYDYNSAHPKAGKPIVEIVE